MNMAEPFLDIGTLTEQNIDRVAEALRELLSQPYLFRRRNHLLGTSWLDVPCLHPNAQASASVRVGRSPENFLVLSIQDPRYEVARWEVPEMSGFYLGLDDIYFRTVDHGDLEYLVRLL